MADFTFDDDKPNGNGGNEAGGTVNGKPGTSGNGASTENGVNGTTFNGSGTTGEVGNDPSAPLGYTADGKPRKRRAGGGRKPNSGDTASNAGNTADASNKVGLGVKNDRQKVKANIAGLHAMAAVLTKQPILNLNDNEATALTNSLCDVADYHNFNLISAGGAFGLYASLATTAYMIYVPRAVAIKMKKASDEAVNVTPGRAREEATNRAGKMDFGADIGNA